MVQEKHKIIQNHQRRMNDVKPNVVLITLTVETRSINKSNSSLINPLQRTPGVGNSRLRWARERLLKSFSGNFPQFTWLMFSF